MYRTLAWPHAGLLVFLCLGASPARAVDQELPNIIFIMAESIAVASGIARDAAKPITDMRGTIEYRKHLCEVLTRRGLNIAIDRAKENS